jgi:sugar phosphate isomerase/epimerase
MKPPEQVARELLTDMYALKSCLPYLPVPELETRIAAALTAAWYEAIEECAKVAEEYWKSGKNVYARHAGRAIETRILAKLGGGA